MVFQDPYASLDPRMSVGRIVGEPLWALDIDGDRRARVREVLEQVGLEPEMANRFPHEFSGGQRQRIAIARAIVHRPRLLIGDEPLSALDVTVRAQILALLRDLRATEGLALVLVSHDIGVVQNLCDSVVVMKDGRIVEEGPTERVLLEPQVAYTRRLLASIPTIDPAAGA
jgi:peptide/nickel transport system ATP-binding protein